MPAVKSSLVQPRYRTEYRVRNWREYEKGLRSRGDVTIWFSDEATANWIARSTGARGGARLCSTVAIDTSLTLRTVFGMPLRQAGGLVGSLPGMPGLDHPPVPDHGTLSRRSRSPGVASKATRHRGSPHLIVDRTGLLDRWRRHVGRGQAWDGTPARSAKASTSRSMDGVSSSHAARPGVGLMTRAWYPG